MASNYKQQTAQAFAPDHLEHYGVLGMKWGVHRGRVDEAYTKGSNKLRKLDKKVLKRRVKQSKKEAKADRAMANATSNSKYKKAIKAEIKARQAKIKADKAYSKAKKWYNKMTKVFESQKLGDVSQADIDLGKSYAQMIFEERRQGHS